VQADVRPQPLPDQLGDADYLTGAAVLTIPENTLGATAFWRTTLGPGFSRLRSNALVERLGGGMRTNFEIRITFGPPIIPINRLNPAKSDSNQMLGSLCVKTKIAVYFRSISNCAISGFFELIPTLTDNPVAFL
jgi:hypothetical protein